MSYTATTLAIVFAIITVDVAAGSPLNLRGISPQDESYYKTGTIWCKDRSKSFSAERLNDDFCDCPDGTDEPGTSACPSGKFYCKNRGHTPLLLFSSRVNDGICDCCDGSDEYDGRARCTNTCSEAGKVLMEKLDRKITTFKSGLEIRKRDVENAKQMIQKDKVELSSLKQEEKKLKDLVHKLKAKKEAIEKVEKLEREREEKVEREKEEKRKRELEEQNSLHESTELKEDHSMEQSTKMEDNVGSSEENHMEGDPSEANAMDSMSKEELGRLVASRWTGEDPNAEANGNEGANFDESPYNGEDDDANLNHEQEDESAPEDEDEDDENDDLDETNNQAIDESKFSDNQDEEGPWLWMKVKDFVRSISSFYSLSKLPIDKSETDRIRKDYDDSTSKLRKIQSKISDLEKKLEQDFGKDGEFYGFYGQCFELQQKKYTYKVCPYRNGLQVEGHSTTTLGNWDGFKDEHKSMQFVRGDKCWNGPDRSLKVKLRCGIKIELRDVDEPSRCEYVAELSTPALCVEERLIALQQKRNNQGDALHDEL